MKKSNILFLVLIFLFACKKDNDDSASINSFTAEHGGVYISNEGNFQSANSTISYYNPADKTFSENPFQLINNQSLGDLCQSMNIINNKLYIVVNNSGKIEVCNPYTMLKETSIIGLSSPRYIIPVSNSKAYVSDGYSNNLSVINLASNTITSNIEIKGWTEQMLLINNMVYVTNTSTNYLYIVDPNTDILEDSVLISKGANSILEDLNGKIWVLCGGDYLHTYNGALYRVDPSTNQVEENISFAADEYPSRLSTDSVGDKLYFLNNGVFKMSIYDQALPGSPLIISSGNNFYGLGIDKIKNEIYVSDAIDYIQRGKVFRYRTDGTPIDNFLAGIIPGDFLFIP